MDTQTELAKLRALHEAVNAERQARDLLNASKRQTQMFAYNAAKDATDVALRELAESA